MARAHLSILAAAALAAGASAQSSKLLFNQSLSYAVYTGAAVARSATAGSPTFGFATWLNPPIEAEVYAANGQPVWSFTSNFLQSTFQIDMARHTNVAGVGAVDTAVLEANFALPSNCTAYGFISQGPKASATPVWSVTIDECESSLLYDQYRYIDISDDGSTVAFAVYANQTVDGHKNLTARLYVVDAQTGKQKFVYNLGPSVAASYSGVNLNQDGSLAAYTNYPVGYIVNCTTGKVIDSINLPSSIAFEVSLDGSYVTTVGLAEGFIYQWNATQGQYILAYSVKPPANNVSSNWYPESQSLSSYDPSSPTGELVAYGWVSEDSLTARVTVYSMLDGQLLTDYVTKTNAKLQTNPTVRGDRDYVGVSLWGDSDDVPTAIVLKAGTNKPVFTYVTPGSMFGVDLVVDSSSATADNVYFAVAGKHVPANMFGNGGDAYCFFISIPN